MRVAYPGRLLLPLAAIASLGLGASPALAGAILPYSVTDLGEGEVRTATGADGRGVVVSADGRATYPFPTTDNSLPSEQGNAIANTLPPFTNAPVWASMTYGNPRNAYSYLTGPYFLNREGTFVGTDVSGVSGHIQAAGSSLVILQRQGDGTFAPYPSARSVGAPENFYSGGQPAQALALNNRDQILAVAGIFSPPNRSFFLLDEKAKQTIDLQTLLPPGWHIDWPLALDDLGKILVTADSQATGWKPHTLLLTPEGLSADPVPVPEPTTLALLALGAGAGLLGRRPRPGR